MPLGLEVYAGTEGTLTQEIYESYEYIQSIGKCIGKDMVFINIGNVIILEEE